MQRASASEPARTSNGRISWVRSITPTCGAMSRMTALDDADELVGGAVVGEERDGVEARHASDATATDRRGPGRDKGRCQPPDGTSPVGAARLSPERSPRRHCRGRDAHEKSVTRKFVEPDSVNAIAAGAELAAALAVAATHGVDEGRPAWHAPRARAARPPWCRPATSPSPAARPDRRARRAAWTIRRAAGRPSARRSSRGSPATTPASISASATRNT